MPDQTNAEIRIVAALDRVGADLQSHRNLIDKLAVKLEGASAKAAAGAGPSPMLPDIQKQIAAGQQLITIQKGLAQATGDASTAQLAALAKLQVSYVGLGQAAKALAATQSTTFGTSQVNQYNNALTRLLGTLRNVAAAAGGSHAAMAQGGAAGAVGGAFHMAGGGHILGGLPGISALPTGMRAAGTLASAMPSIGAGGVLGAIGLTGVGAIAAQLATWAIHLPAAADRFTQTVPRVEGLYRRGAGRAMADRTGYAGTAAERDELRRQVLDRGLPFGYGREEALGVAETLAAAGGTLGFDGSSARLDTPMRFARAMGVDLRASTNAFAAAERMGAAGIMSGVVPSAFGGTVQRLDGKQLADVFAQGIDQSKMRGREAEFLQTVTGLAGVIAQRTVDAPDLQHITGMLTALNATGVPGLRGQAGADVLAGVNKGVAGARGPHQLLLYQLYRAQNPKLGFAQFLLEQEKGLESEYLPGAIAAIPGLIGDDEATQAVFLSDLLGGNVSRNQALALIRQGPAAVLSARQAPGYGITGAALPAEGASASTLAPAESAVAAVQRFNAAMDEMAGQTLVPLTEKLNQFEANLTGSTNGLIDAAGHLFGAISDGIGNIAKEIGLTINPPTAYAGELTPEEKAAQDKAAAEGVPMPLAPGAIPGIPVYPTPPPNDIMPVIPPQAASSSAPGVPSIAPEATPEAIPQDAAPAATPPPALSDIPNVNQASGGRDSAARGCSAGALTAILNGAGVDIDEGTVFQMMVREGVILNDGLHDSKLAAFVKRHWGLDVSQSITSTRALREALGSNRPVMLSVNGVQRPGQYREGHLVTGVSADDSGLTVMDPARGERHTFTWAEFAQVSRMDTNPGLVFNNWADVAQANRARIAGPSMSPIPSDQSGGPGGAADDSIPPEALALGIPDTEIARYIARAARARGIDPTTALRVAMSEGGVTEPARQSNYMYRGRREESYGPFQLFTSGGLGNEFQRQTGLDIRDPANWQAGVDFALDWAAGNGWNPGGGGFHGATRVGIGNWEGIGVPSGLAPGVGGLRIAFDPVTVNVRMPDGSVESVQIQPRARHISEAEYLSRVAPRNVGLAGAPLGGMG